MSTETTTTLLPPNATPLERRIASSGAAQMDAILPAPIIPHLWNADTCPLSLLHTLAWAEAVEVWDPAWDEGIKRSVVRESRAVHRQKGTVAAVRRALASIGYGIDIIEWHKDVPRAAPYTFRITVIDTYGEGITEAKQDRILDIINRTKNVRSHLTGMSFTSVTPGSLYIGGAVLISEIITLDNMA